MSQPLGPASPYGDPQQPSGGGEPYGGGQPYGYPAPTYGHPAPNPYPPQPGGYGGQQPYGHPQPGFPPFGYPGQPYGYGTGGPGPGPGMGGMPPLASWGARLGAMLLDYLLFFSVPTGLIAAAYARLGIAAAKQFDKCDKMGISTEDCPGPHKPGGFTTLLVIGGLLSLAATLVAAWREGATGQTPGKRIVGIRLLKQADGSNLGFGRAFGRRLLHVLDSLACYIGWLMPLWDARRQTFADKMVHTVVVRDPS